MAIDLGTGSVPAKVEFCFDGTGSMSLLRVSFPGDNVGRHRLLKLLETRWKTFLTLGVADSFSKKGATAFWDAVALDDGDCHAVVSWSETANGEIPALSLSIVPGAADWVSTTQEGERIRHEIHDEDRVRWRYDHCSDRFSP
jgi:hypothetical protein